jgi:hypothetical protein
MPKHCKKSKPMKLEETTGILVQDLVRWTVSYPFELSQTLMKVRIRKVVQKLCHI